MYNLALFNMSDVGDTTPRTLENAENLLKEMEYNGVLRSHETYSLVNKIRSNLLAIDIIYHRDENSEFTKKMEKMLDFAFADQTREQDKEKH